MAGHLRPVFAGVKGRVNPEPAVRISFKWTAWQPRRSTESTAPPGWLRLANCLRRGHRAQAQQPPRIWRPGFHNPPCEPGRPRKGTDGQRVRQAGVGSLSRTRTYDRAINSRLLYQLSYQGSPRGVPIPPLPPERKPIRPFPPPVRGIPAKDAGSRPDRVPMPVAARSLGRRLPSPRQRRVRPPVVRRSRRSQLHMNPPRPPLDHRHDRAPLHQPASPPGRRLPAFGPRKHHRLISLQRLLRRAQQRTRLQPRRAVPHRRRPIDRRRRVIPLPPRPATRRPLSHGGHRHHDTRQQHENHRGTNDRHAPIIPPHRPAQQAHLTCT